MVLQKEQLDSHEVQLAQLDQELNEHKKGPIPSKGLALQNYKEKESYLQYEVSFNYIPFELNRLLIQLILCTPAETLPHLCEHPERQDAG